MLILDSNSSWAYFASRVFMIMLRNFSS
uniref:Uncharacterized protein n=1 Tax=Rhizophora mucronata TaxID=61149 RepID=A0A2P2N8Y3_RHIMU